MNKLVLHEKKLFRSVEHDLYVGFEQVPETEIQIVEHDLKFQWRGAKMPFDLWAQVVSFMRWSQKQFKEEAMLFFFYHVENRQWAAWVFPQEPNGMTVNMLPDHPLYAPDRARFGAGWIQAGTVHHHCTAKAFQSGTDRGDEQDRDGLHVTLGEMDKDTLDLHCRQVFDGIQSTAKLTDWVDLPAWLVEAPKYLRYSFFDYTLRSIRDNCHPKEWESRVIKKVFIPGPANTGASAAAPSSRTLVTGKDAATPPDHGYTGQVWQSKYRFKCIMRVRDVLNRLSLTPETAMGLLASRTNQDDAARALAGELRRALLAEGIIMLYAEDYLREIVEDDTMDAPAVAGQ